MPDPFRLHVVGWRHLVHSFAIVNQWQLLSLLKRQDVQLSFEDAPMLAAHWRHTEGAFGAAETAALSSLSLPSGPVDAEYRIAFPFNIAPRPDDRKTFVFGVSEGGLFHSGTFIGGDRPSDINDRSNMRLVVPSRWASDCFTLDGVRPDIIDVVPHGVDTETFRPDDSARTSLRQSLGIGGFAFLNVSAMQRGKGVSALLEAFGHVLEGGAKATLVLKGQDAFYGSQSRVQKYLSKMSERRRSLVADKLVYVGRALDMKAMARLYNAADS